MKHVFIVGSKGIPAQYGGFETFVEELTKGKQSPEIMYHVSCMNNDEKHFEYNGADCFNVRVPLPGAPGRIFHVGLVLDQVEMWVKANPNEDVIVYILGCRIGPLLILHSKCLHKLGAKIYCNPDGLEWKRDKWSTLEKNFLRYCEKCLVKNSDLVVCDSVNIEKYIKKTYGSQVKSTTYIAYGAYIKTSNYDNNKLQEFYKKFGLSENNYYLIVGRFVPENNYETIITEFMRSKTKRELVIITDVKQNKFYEELSQKTGFKKDQRIKFVGTVYDEMLLRKIREEAYGYIHGHEVGGTNPSLLEALATTKINLLLNVSFNKEVGMESVIYWEKSKGNLKAKIEMADSLEQETINLYAQKAKNRIEESYSWCNIIRKYESIFTECDR